MDSSPFISSESSWKSKTQPSYISALHSVSKPLQPKPMMKKPIAPMPPTPPKIYKVDSSNFKQVVQRLTSVPEFQSKRLQEVAPPRLDLLPPATTFLPADHKSEKALPLQLLPSNFPTELPLSAATFFDLTNETLETNPASMSDNFATTSPMGFSNLSSPANCLAWCSFLLESPGNLSTLDSGTVL